jgi:CubicO group peptidase (beta-lactamase class C family)
VPRVPPFAAALVATAGVVAASLAGSAQKSASPVAADVLFAEALTAADDLPRLYSLLVSRRGELLLERYYNGARASRPTNVKSASKSVISALVGIAIDRGLVPGVDTPIGTWFPELAGMDDPRRGAITIEQLLTMQSGLQSTSNRYYGAWVLSPNWVRHALTRPMERDPGTDMEYSTGYTHLLSAVLTRATGESTWAFASEALAQPLGFELARWPRDPQGIYFGGNDMLLTSRQMLAFGQLYLDRGRAGETQVVPASWIERSWVPTGRSRFSRQRYGYGWWIRELAGRQAYYAWGFGGQYVVLVPDLDLVVVTTSASDVAEDRGSHRRTLFEIIEDLVIGPVAAVGRILPAT